ncbi:hypothetical protein LY474_39670 [Myxococcus stipitatus]|uniref:hypothetical protein n=1 Tax=Myxococcus stipitatus TaxID=83455 RepID=UPI001F47E2A9|nr:hypothetical protein [Myxococcus stipitatus]MCE9673932.1 hypothetical protein [Myxococcus stipitatus]
MNTESLRLSTVRDEAGARHEERTEHRLTELVVRELSRELTRGMTPPRREPRTEPPPLPLAPVHADTGVDAVTGTPRPQVSTAGTPGPAEVEPPTARVDAALELIERIEAFVKSQRPALSMSLRGTLDATVEVERTGPREVALRIQGRGAPVPEATLVRLREALTTRGLKLSTLRSE